MIVGASCHLEFSFSKVLCYIRTLTLVLDVQSVFITYLCISIRGKENQWNHVLTINSRCARNILNSLYIMSFSWIFCKNPIFSFLPHLCKLFFPYRDIPLKHGKWWVLRFLRESEDDKYWSSGKLSFSESFQVETDNEFVEWVSSWIIQLETIWVTENSIHYHIHVS